MPSKHHIRRVAIVDDDDISRRGLVAVLDESPHIKVVGSSTHDDADRLKPWSGIDVVIVDAADERREDDHFPGVDVVQSIRRDRSADETRVIVITGHYFDDAVRRRMREAKADEMYHRTEIQDAEALTAAVLSDPTTETAVPDPSDPEAMFRLGINDTTRVNDGVAFVKDGSLSVDGPVSPRSRRWQRLRQTFNEITRLHPVNIDGTLPDRDQRDPSLPQIDRFHRWATRTK